MIATLLRGFWRLTPSCSRWIGMVKEKLTSGLAAQGRLAQLIKFGSPATDCWPKFNHKSDRRLLFHRLSTDAKTSWPLYRVRPKMDMWSCSTDQYALARVSLSLSRVKYSSTKPSRVEIFGAKSRRRIKCLGAFCGAFFAHSEQCKRYDMIQAFPVIPRQSTVNAEVYA